MKKTKQEIAWIIICVITCIITIPVFIFNLILSIQALTTPNKLPSVFGISPTVVASGSMSPEFEKNDLIFIQSVDVDALNEKEDVICFVTSDGDYVTHRINRIVVVDGVKRFYTKGDANNAEDKDYILAEQIQGKYVYKIASIGGVVAFMQTPYGMVMVVILLLMIYIGGELLVEIVLQKKENRLLTEENEELKIELKQLRALTYSLAKEEVAQTLIDEEIQELKAMIYSSAKEDIAAERNVEKEIVKEEIEIEEQETSIFDSINSKKIPFATKITQLKDEVKAYFIALHKEIISYKKVNARLSTKAMSYRVGRKLLAKFTVRGKTLTLYLALSLDEFDKNVFFQKDASDKKAYKEVPFMVKVKSDRGAKNAQKLITALVEKENLTRKSQYDYDSAIKQLLAFKTQKEVKTNIDIQVEEIAANKSIFDSINSKKVTFAKKVLALKEQAKQYFIDVHNAFVSYKKVNARLSNKAMSYRVGRKLLAKFTVRGKTLTLCLALSLDEFDKNVFFQKDASDKKAYKEVPFMVKVKSDRGAKNAKKLVVALEQKENLVKDDSFTFDDVISKLIAYKEEVNEKKEETILEDITEFITQEENQNNTEGEKLQKMSETNIFDSIKSKKMPFEDKIAGLKEEVKAYFNCLHNELISYKKVNARLSNKAMSYRVGRKLLAKFSVRGKTLTLCLALPVDEFDKNVFFQVDASSKKAYEEVPFMVKVKSDRGVKNAKKLIIALVEKENLKKDKKEEYEDIISILSNKQ